jgi:hypothetical protein
MGKVEMQLSDAVLSFGGLCETGFRRECERHHVVL